MTATSGVRSRTTLVDRARGTIAVLALVLSAALALPPLTAHAVPPTTTTVPPRQQPTHTDTQSQLRAAHDRAQALRAHLDQLRARQEWANERLAYVRGELAAAASRATFAEQQLDDLRTADAAADAAIAHRVRAIEQSGGVAPLYADALDGTSLSDVVATIATLQSVMAYDDAAHEATSDAVTQAAALQQRLDEVAEQRARLAGQASDLTEQLAALARTERAAFMRASERVRTLARTLARERARAAEAAALAVTPVGAPSVTEATSTPYAKAAVEAALSKLGSPYVWGAEGPDTFDCSGLVQWSYMQAGLMLPRLASDQYFASTQVSPTAMEPGDLLVYAYDPSDGETIHHITMYIGNGQMVHAPRTGDVVRVVPVYQDGLYGVARPGL